MFHECPETTVIVKLLKASHFLDRNRFILFYVIVAFSEPNIQNMNLSKLGMLRV